VARVVYVDSGPLGEGGFISDEFPAENGEIPLPDWSLFPEEDLVDLDDDLRQAFRTRAIPTPEHVATDRQRLSDERRYDVPVTVIACEMPSAMLRQWYSCWSRSSGSLAMMLTTPASAAARRIRAAASSKVTPVARSS
jgi:hypothetical protein